VSPSPETIPTAAAVLDRLLSGNERFVVGRREHPHEDPDYCTRIATGQHPLATIIGCSDSRVSPEIVFDMGCGDLFVIRTAGHVLDGSTLASLEFAVVQLQTPLVAILAHSSCGAVAAAVQQHDSDEPVAGTHVPDLLARIAPAVVASAPTAADPVRAATLEHLRREVEYLRQREPVVAPRHAAGLVAVVGLFENLATRRVEIVVGLPDAGDRITA
jgi:carbonic anhydrase